MMNPPVKPCAKKKVYHPLLRRCVAPDELKDVDVLIDKIANVKVSHDTKYVHLDSSVAVVAKSMTFISSQYPYAHFIFPANTTVSRKGAYTINWKYMDTIKSFVLTLPKNYWDMWIEPMFNPAIRFIISFVHLASKAKPPGFHANVLIYDKFTNEIERFDGLGRDTHPDYGLNEFDRQITSIFEEQRELFPKVPTYFKPDDYCPMMPIFQSKELDEIPGKDTRGNCAVWRFWYVNVRLANPHLQRKELIELAVAKLKNIGNLYKFIKSYQKYITDAVAKEG